MSNTAFSYKALADKNLSFSVNNLNQYTAATGTTPATFAHDLNGNMTSDGAGNTYTYDALNRMTSVSGTNNATLTYGPKGKLIAIDSGGTTTEFLYDGDALIAEYVSGAMVNRYVHGSGVDNPLVWYEGAGTTNKSYLTTDERGSVIGITDSNGSTQINSYDEWGVPSGANIGRFQYTGQVWLSEVQLYYYKARMYWAGGGRFMQTDPIGYDDGMNLYAYVGGDPVNFVDPTGLEACPRNDPDCIDDPDTETEGAEQEITEEQKENDDIVVKATKKKKLGSTRIDFTLPFPDEQYFRLNDDGSIETVEAKEVAKFSCPSGEKSRTVLNRSSFQGARAGGHTHPNWAKPGTGPDDGVLPNALGITGYVISPQGTLAIEHTSVGFRARLIDGRWGATKNSIRRRISKWNRNRGKSGEKCVRKK